jgi:ribosome maturation factor RimP
VHEPEVGASPPFRSEGLVEPMDAEALVKPVVEGAGFELVEVDHRGGGSGRSVLRVTIDREGGVDLDAVAEVSERISRRLDLEDFGAGRYDLEVSSPGIERPLRSPAQFRRARGERVKVKTTEEVAGAKVHTGTLVDVDDDSVTVEVDGAPVRLPLSSVASARTVADWAAELKGIAG